MVNYKNKRVKKILRGSEATGAKEQLLPEAEEEWAVGNKGPESLPTKQGPDLFEEGVGTTERVG